jgi:hypothetical protein
MRFVRPPPPDAAGGVGRTSDLFGLLTRNAGGACTANRAMFGVRALCREYKQSGPHPISATPPAQGEAKLIGRREQRRRHPPQGKLMPQVPASVGRRLGGACVASAWAAPGRRRRNSILPETITTSWIAEYPKTAWSTCCTDRSTDVAGKLGAVQADIVCR